MTEHPIMVQAKSINQQYISIIFWLHVDYTSKEKEEGTKYKDTQVPETQIAIEIKR